MRIKSTQQSTTTNADAEVIGEMSLEPGQQSSFLVGIYENLIPQPKISFKLSPKNCKVDSALVRAEEHGDYQLTYHFKNDQSERCTITVFAT